MPEAEVLSPIQSKLRPDRTGTLRGHIARGNTLWRQLERDAPVLVIFQGADSYISPNWYPSKHETHRQVPTWNYEVVHAHGTLTVHDDPRFVRALVGRLTRQHEAGEPRPWTMADSAPDYIDAMLRNIVGLEIAVTALVGKSKLGQNKDARDRLGAAETLRARANEELARRMHDVGD